MTFRLKTGDTSTKEQLFDFLRKVAKNVTWVDKDEIGFSRTVAFYVLGQSYRICWHHNLCSLFVGIDTERPFQLHFDTIRTDTCYPCYSGGNDNLTFEYNGYTMAHLPLETGFLYKNSLLP